MNIDRLQSLKQKLTDVADLSHIWSFYMDHFADQPEFTDLGEPADNEYLDAVLYKTCQQMFGRPIKITGFFLIYIPNYRLFHGPFQVEGRIGGVIYFEDIKIGLIAVSADYPPTDAVKYSRFTEVIQLSALNGNDYN
ncbi:MAG: hypothetical protein HWQ38_00045 [Nostoc sp. NMS7]|uniref:hypothetical protein n=1 Tax=Nostoc sp. NMS7 TaxID=2815391 RepID=UPI0025FA8330|nr:hypothetical protein [Nostoc sp. NMS7]MBN3944956.1 hypothetical protein [Nostoc sp. NMS7]